MQVPASESGAVVRCVYCGCGVRLTEENTGPLTRDETDVDLVVDDKEDLSEVDLFLDDEEDLAVHDSQAEAAGIARPESPGRDVFSPETASAPETVERCARCGRPFRGEWDRFQGNEGAVCNICANLAAEQDPAVPRPSIPTPQPHKAFRNPGWSALEAEPSKELSPEDKRRRNAQMIGLAAIALITITVYVLWPAGEGAPGRGVEPEAAEAAARELSRGVDYLLRGIRLVLGIATKALALYLALMAVNKLPNETFLKNLAAVLVVAVPLYLIGFIPLAGGFIIMLIIVHVVFDPGLGGLVYFVVFNVLASMLTGAVGKLIYGALGLALT